MLSSNKQFFYSLDLYTCTYEGWKLSFIWVYAIEVWKHAPQKKSGQKYTLKIDSAWTSFTENKNNYKANS